MVTVKRIVTRLVTTVMLLAVFIPEIAHAGWPGGHDVVGFIRYL